MRANQKTGKAIIPFGVRPEAHELDTVDVFLAMGENVEFIAPSRTKQSKTPDIKMQGVLWEMKSPTGTTKKTIERQLQRAVKQSKYVIFDGRRTKLDDGYIEKELKRQMSMTRSLKRLIFITKSAKAIDIAG